MFKNMKKRYVSWNEIENLYKFNHTHKKRDWISMSKSLIETYDIRLKS